MIKTEADTLAEEVNKAANRFCELTEERIRLAKRQRKQYGQAEVTPGKDLTRLLFDQQVESRKLREEANEAHKEWRKLVRGIG